MSDDYGAAAAAAMSAGMQISGDAIATKRKNKRALEWWKMQNEYNHPRSQMQRLQEAGLNPNLIYGDSVAGATGKADSVGVPDRVSNFGNPVATFQDIRQSNAQTNLLALQATTEMQRAGLVKAQKAKTWEDANRSSQDYRLTEDTYLDSVQLKRLAVQNVQQEILGKQLENDFKEESMRSRVADMYWKVQNAEASLKGRNLQNELLRMQSEFLNLGLDRNSPWYAKIFGNLINKTLEK